MSYMLRIQFHEESVLIAGSYSQHVAEDVALEYIHYHDVTKIEVVTSSGQTVKVVDKSTTFEDWTVRMIQHSIRGG